MIKREDVRRGFDRFGFNCLNECERTKKYRFMASAVHIRTDIRVTVSAAPRNNRSAIVEITDGACRKLPGVATDIKVSRFEDVEAILEAVASGGYS